MGGSIFLIVWMIVGVATFVVVIQYIRRHVCGWWGMPAGPMTELPPPSKIGTGCLIYLFADLFCSVKDSVPEPIENRYISVPSTSKFIGHRELVEEVLVSVLGRLVADGRISFRTAGRGADPFTGLNLHDWELFVNRHEAFGLTPLGRSLEIGWMDSVNNWFHRRSGDRAPALTNVIDGTVRAMRQELGRTRCSGDACRDIVAYIQHFLIEKDLLASREGPWGLFSRPVFVPIADNIEQYRSAASELRRDLEGQTNEEPELFKQIRGGVEDALSSIQQFEGDREGII